MWKTIIGALSLVALSGLAIAADVRDSVGSAPAPSPPDWSGFYIGGHFGGVRSRSENWTVRTQGGAFYGESLGSHDADGRLGGVQVGYNYQYAPGFVIGIQGDYALADADGSHDSTKEFGVAYHSKVNSVATVTGRFGYASDRLLGYVRGGVAWERDDLWATTIMLGTAYRASVTRPGWTVGVGAEYAFTRFLSGFAEYGYYNFGTRQIEFTPQVSGLPTGFLDITQTTNVVRVGINYRFGGTGVPKTARD